MIEGFKKPMGGNPPEDKYPLQFPLYASLKLDGVRVAMNGRTPCSRSMKNIPNHYLRAQLEGDPALARLDMELIMGDPTDELCYNKTYSAYSAHEGEPQVTLYVFDYIDMGLEFELRQQVLQGIFAEKPFTTDLRVVQLKQRYITCQEELDELYSSALADGYEGLILRHPLGKYKNGKSTAKEQWMLKLKPHEDSEFEVTGFYEAMENLNEAFTNELGETARSSHQENKVGKGMLGGFYGKLLTTGQEIKVAPGKLKHAERTEIWNNQSAYIGRIAKQRSFPIGVLNLPRHGRWIGWRDATDMEQP